jgi:hypothetical protein
MPIKTNVGSTWKSASKISTNVGGAWKTVNTISSMVGTEWKKVWNYGNDNYTTLLLHFDGADEATSTTDSSSLSHTVTFVGNAKIDTAQSVFGGSSCYFDGIDSCLTIPYSAGFDLGTGDFTIEFRYRDNRASVGNAIVTLNKSIIGGNYWQIKNDSSKKIIFLADVGGDTLEANYKTATWTASVDTTYHFAFVRSGTSMKFFVDGVEQTLTELNAISTNNLSLGSGTLIIGDQVATGDSMPTKGWIDELRISKGIARWTENFTPSAVQYD